MISLYVDSAERAEVEPLLRSGAFSGCTTNPKLLQRAGLTAVDLPDVYAWMVDAGAREVFLQTWGDDLDAMYAQAQRLLAIGDRVVIKVPASAHGIAVAGRLHAAGAPVLLTAVYATHQALTAGALGLEYVAPYLGQLGDAGMDGRAMLGSMHRLLRATSSPTRVVAASLRSTSDISWLAEHGIDAFAIPASVAQRLFEDSHTAEAVRQFDAISAEW